MYCAHAPSYWGSSEPASPVDDRPGFAVPASAAAPSQIFEGTLTLSNPGSSGSFRLLRDDEKIDTGTDSPWRHLASFSFQVIYNITMSAGLAPVKGLTLPLMSYGGSSMIATLAGFGLVLNVRMRRFTN